MYAGISPSLKKTQQFLYEIYFHIWHNFCWKNHTFETQGKLKESQWKRIRSTRRKTEKWRWILRGKRRKKPVSTVMDFFSPHKKSSKIQSSASVIGCTVCIRAPYLESHHDIASWHHRLLWRTWTSSAFQEEWYTLQFPYTLWFLLIVMFAMLLP